MTLGYVWIANTSITIIYKRERGDNDLLSRHNAWTSHPTNYSMDQHTNNSDCEIPLDYNRERHWPTCFFLYTEFLLFTVKIAIYFPWLTALRSSDDLVKTHCSACSRDRGNIFLNFIIHDAGSICFIWIEKIGKQIFITLAKSSQREENN